MDLTGLLLLTFISVSLLSGVLLRARSTVDRITGRRDRP